MTIAGRTFLVTGGTGFIGAALVRRLVAMGGKVRVFDNNSRGSPRRLGDVAREVEVVDGDIRDAAAVSAAAVGVDCVWHLAYVNGTRFFYERPELVLEVGVKGMFNVLDACKRHGVRELVLASSSEVYQTPPSVPTDETAPLSIPDPRNPRYSYGGGKIISELLAINYGRKDLDRVLIFRPHNVYGADMGWEHVIPELTLRLRNAIDADPAIRRIELPIQGTGSETRAFVHIDDLCDGLALIYEKGEHLEIYHVGNDEEVTIADLAQRIGACMDRDISIVPGPPAAGATARRCPDIAKLRALGYEPRRPLAEGLPPVVEWYRYANPT
ncbi:MAG: NAD-dependent epimerase/dehydratase family protein [Vulcanimicrobiaceae bacterium]